MLGICMTLEHQLKGIVSVGCMSIIINASMADKGGPRWIQSNQTN